MKLNILFVDDEINVINGLKRMLRPLRNEWNFFFALCGEEALAIVNKSSIDIIVTDMKMPKMNGAQLLEKIKETHPSIIRFILSGQSNMELALKSTRTVHQFLAKPIQAEKLKEKISRSYKLFSILENENIRNVINGIQTLPSIPSTYFAVEEELQKEEFSLMKIAVIIRKDAVMSAKILQLVNSAFFGLPANISDIVAAVNLLGANTVKYLILYVNLFSTFETNSEINNLLSDIWVHSLRVAKSAKQIILYYKDDKEEAETAYTAGLMHDIGKIVILNNRNYREKIFKIREQKGLDFDTAEFEALNTSHAVIGGYLLSLWGLPEDIVEIVLFHHSYEMISSGEINGLSAVQLANAFSNSPHLNLDWIKTSKLKKKLPKILEICNNK